MTRGLATPPTSLTHGPRPWGASHGLSQHHSGLDVPLLQTPPRWSRNSFVVSDVGLAGVAFIRWKHQTSQPSSQRHSELPRISHGLKSTSAVLMDGVAVESEPRRRLTCGTSSQVSELHSRFDTSCRGCDTSEVVPDHLVQRGPPGLGKGTRTSNKLGLG